MTTRQITTAITLDAQSGVDRDAAVIKDALLVGRASHNGWAFGDGWFRDYEQQAEGGQVYLDHGTGRGPRSVRDLIGVTKRVRITTDGARGDIALNRSHEMTAAILDWAEHEPGAMGMSQHTISHFQKGKAGEPMLLTGIEQLVSTDIVTKPASTNSFFDQMAGAAARDAIAAMVQRVYGPLLDNVVQEEINQNEVLRAIDNAINTAWGLVYQAFFDEVMTLAQKSAHIAQIMADLQETVEPLTARLETAGEGADDMEPKDVTLDWLQEHKPELVKQIAEAAQPTADAEDAGPSEAERRLALMELRDEVLADADLPAEAQSAAFKDSLLRVGGDTPEKQREAMTGLVQDRRTVWFKDEGAVRGRGADATPAGEGDDADAREAAKRITDAYAPDRASAA